MDWISDWIWRSRRVEVNDFAYFRKEFSVRPTWVSARLYVSAHHYVHVYVNGAKIGGYGTPAPTDPWKRKYYTEYDVGGHIMDGANCITADVHYLGGSGQNTVDGLPGFRLELHLLGADGAKQVVKTDTSWETLVEMPRRSGASFQQNRRISAVEQYDARKWDESWRKAGWSGEGRAAKAEMALIDRGSWPMVLQTVPEGAIERELSVTKLASPTDGEGENAENAQVFDVGYIVSGWPKFTLKGFEGVTLRLRYSENLDADGRVGHNVANESSEFYYDEYTMRGDESESWQPHFSYKAFRYVEVTGYPLPIEPGSGLTVCMAYTKIERKGSFQCSDDMLNRLYLACIQTQKNNALGQIVDCPHREQAQYIADTDLQAELLLYNFDALPLLEKTLSDFADAQLEDGTFPFVAPTNFGNTDFNIQIPEWDLHYATLLWKLYDTSGDREVLSRYYRPLRRMVDYFIGKLDPSTGLMPLDKGWHISDWPYPSVEHHGEFLTVQQIKLYQAVKITGKIASLIGEQDESDAYGQQAEKLCGNIIKHLYVLGSGVFRDSSESDRMHQGVTAVALFAGIVPEQDRKMAIAYVAEKQWECCTVLSLPLLRALFDNKRSAEAFEILNRRSYPGWGYMIEQGARTMWEGWDDIESHSHAWNGYPARLLQEYVVGIRSEAPGFKKAVIRPYMPDQLSYAEASVWTVQGELSAGWEKMIGGGYRFKANVPTGIAARLEVTLHEHAYVKELQAGENEWTIKPISESFVFVKEERLPLRHQPLPGMRVRMYGSSDAHDSNRIEYAEGSDYVYDHAEGTIRRTPASSIPDWANHPMHGLTKRFDHLDYEDYSNNRYTVYAEYEYGIFRDRLTAGDRARGLGAMLPKAVSKLQAGEEVVYAVYGDSISAGGEASAERFAFYRRFADYLEGLFPGGSIRIVNVAVGGESSEGGAARAASDLLPLKSDLVSIGYGMNDQNLYEHGVAVTPEEYERNLRQIIDAVKENGDADLLLLTPCEPNPLWRHTSGRMDEYGDVVRRLGRLYGVAVADVQALWKQELSAGKTPESLLLNNVNHPNDYGHYLYFQALTMI